MIFMNQDQLTISDIMLARVGSVSSSVFEKFIFKDTKIIIHELFEVEKQLEEIKDVVIDILHATVPKFGDKKALLRSTIKLKRDIFNNRCIKINSEVLKEILFVLNNEEKNALKMYFSLYDQKISLEKDLALTYKNELKHIEKKLLDFYQSKEARNVLMGIPLASGNFAEVLLKNPVSLLDIKSNQSKTAFSYLQRCAVKTSPFSTFTHLTTASIKERKKNLSRNRGRNLLKVNRAIISLIGEGLALKYKDFFTYSFNPIVNLQNEKGIIKNNYMHTDGFLWKKEELVKNDSLIKFIESLSGKLNENTFYLSDLEKNVQSGKDKLLIRSLISSKLIRPNLPISTNDPAPFKSLANYLLEECKCESNAIIQNLILLHEKYIEIEDELNSYQKRYSLIQDFKELIEGIFVKLSVKKPVWIKDASLIYEDVKSDIDHITLNNHIKKDLEEVFLKIKENIKITPVYKKIIDYFVKTYENQTINLLDFIFTLESNEKEYSEIIEGAYSFSEYESSPQKEISNQTTALPTSSIYYQLVASSREEIEKGNYFLVVNKVYTGIGNIFARFNELFDYKEYGEYLRNWIENIFPGSIPTEFCSGGDWSNLQECFQALNQNLNGLGELNYMKTENESMNLQNLQIRYSSSSDSLEIIDQNGSYISPVYVGTIPQYLIRGAIGLLLNIVNPWVISTDYGINPKPWEAYSDYKELTYFPRRQEGRIIYNRAKWIIPIQLFPTKNQDISDASYYRKLQEFLRVHNISNEVYMTVQNSQGFLQGNKPIWIHFDSPHCLEILLKKIKDKVKYIVFTEAIPSYKENWLDNQENKTMVSEFMSLGRWSKDGN